MTPPNSKLRLAKEALDDSDYIEIDASEFDLIRSALRANGSDAAAELEDKLTGAGDGHKLIVCTDLLEE